MLETLTILGVVVAWFLLANVVLPRFGLRFG